MERKLFLKTLVATATLSVANPFSLMDIFVEESDIILPFIDGKKKITLLRRKSGMISSALAQTGYQTQYGYQQYYDYNSLAPYQQWYAYQQALAYWQQQLYNWQQQQYYTWLQQGHIQQMQYLLAQYQNYQQIGQPVAMDSVQSIYGFAKDSSNQPTLFGLNQTRNPVEIKQTTKGTAKIFDIVNNYYGEEEAEKAAAPQSSEGRAMINLPNNSQLRGNYFKTKNGILAVSDPDQQVVSSTGEQGQLGKYVTGSDGERYTVV